MLLQELFDEVVRSPEPWFWPAPRFKKKDRKQLYLRETRKNFTFSEKERGCEQT